MAKIQNLKEKVQNATDKVEKCKATIARHEKALEKKKQALIKQGYDISDLEAIKDKARETIGEEASHKLYWDADSVESKLDDIKRANKKLQEAESVLNNWILKLEKEKSKDEFINNSIPQVIKDFLDRWKSSVFEYYTELYNEYQNFKIEQIKLGLDDESVQSKEVNFADYVLLEMDNIMDDEERLKWLDNTLEEERKSKIIDFMNRISKVVGEIKDASNLRISDKGNIDGTIKGTESDARIQTISASGEVQRFHYRTLVNKIK